MMLINRKSITVTFIAMIISVIIVFTGCTFTESNIDKTSKAEDDNEVQSAKTSNSSLNTENNMELNQSDKDEESDSSPYTISDNSTDITSLTGYKRLYYDFYINELSKIEDYIEGISLLDLDFNGIYELIVYLPGASASGSSEIYTIEDGEVRAFSGRALPEEVWERNVPYSKNAVKGMFWANLPSGMLKDWQIEFWNIFKMYHNRKTGENIFVIHTGNAAGEKDSWNTWVKFKNLNGALSAVVIFSYEKVGGYDEKSGKFETLKWLINNKSVNEEEYEAAIINFETDFYSKYELVNFDYSNYSIYKQQEPGISSTTGNVNDPGINADTFAKFLSEFSGF